MGHFMVGKLAGESDFYFVHVQSSWMIRRARAVSRSAQMLTLARLAELGFQLGLPDSSCPREALVLCQFQHVSKFV